MTEKQYLEAVNSTLEMAKRNVPINKRYCESLHHETERRLEALKAQEDNIKSDHWEEK